MNDGTDIRVTLLINEDGAVRKYGLNVPFTLEGRETMRPEGWEALAHQLGEAVRATVLTAFSEGQGGELPRILEGHEYPTGWYEDALRGTR